MRTARFTLETEDRGAARALLQEWSERADLTILRGRISPELSHYDLEIRGASSIVARALRQAASAQVPCLT